MSQLFLDVDGHGDLCAWTRTGPDDERPEPIARRCDLTAEAWALIVEGVARRSSEYADDWSALMDSVESRARIGVVR